MKKREEGPFSRSAMPRGERYKEVGTGGGLPASYDAGQNYIVLVTTAFTIGGKTFGVGNIAYLNGADAAAQVANIAHVSGSISDSN